jgi:hypothetical protein
MFVGLAGTMEFIYIELLRTISWIVLWLPHLAVVIENLLQFNVLKAVDIAS